jgi:transcriptional regulator with XRE-family HTH domain
VNDKQTAELRYLATLVRSRQIRQSTIALATGVHQSQVSRILSGRMRRSSKNVQILCKYANLYQQQERGNTVPSADALCEALLRVWDGTHAHAEALIKTMEAIQAVQDAIRRGK